MQANGCIKELKCQKYPNCKGCWGFVPRQEAHETTFLVEEVSHNKTRTGGETYTLREKSKVKMSRNNLVFDCNSQRLKILQKMYGTQTPYQLVGKVLTVITLEDDNKFLGNGMIFIKYYGNENRVYTREEVLATESIFG